jgi:cell division protein FtsA
VAITDTVLEPLASAKSVLSRKQKELGVVLIDIGGSTTAVAVYEEGELLHATILPVGSGHITNDIAIGLRTSVEVAEKVKLEYGSATVNDIGRREEINLGQFDSLESGSVSRHHVAEIIQARLEEIFTMVDKELKSIGKAGLLPSGAVLTGGGSKLPQIVDLAKDILRLPIQVGFPVNLGGMMDKVDDPSFATVIGLIMWEKDRRNFTGTKANIFGGLSQEAGHTVGKMRRWIDKFLP